jgi:hypothetical protein
MKTCPHCSKGIHFESYHSSAYAYDDKKGKKKSSGYAVTHGFCPACDELIVLLEEGTYQEDKYGSRLATVTSEEVIYPKSASRPVQPEVPDIYKDDYLEAAAVLNMSPKASAAISRRLLQCVLRECVFRRKSPLDSDSLRHLIPI